MNEIYSVNNIIMYAAMSVGISFLLTFIALKFMHLAQLNNYDSERYYSAITSRDKKYIKTLIVTSLLAFLVFGLFSAFFYVYKYNNEFIELYGLIPFAAVVALFFIADLRTKKKVRLKITNRVKRLIVTNFLLIFVFAAIFSVMLNTLSLLIKFDYFTPIKYAPLSFLIIFVPYILVMALDFNAPLEKSISKSFIKRANERLEANPELIKIGITGSFGKTSVKNILAVILSEKYKVCASPKSYNTPMGLCRTVLENLKIDDDVLICEMGAKKVGDIKKLCETVKPDYGVITGVNNQHLETFLSIDNIKKTKFELAEGVSDKGIVVFSSDNAISVELYRKCAKSKLIAGINDGGGNKPFVTAKDISMTNAGSEFLLIAEGVGQVKCNTILLGAHNISNILMSAALALKLGLTLENIAAGVSKIKQLPHRLELVKGKNNVTVIDDSYNSNVNGIRAALDTLKLFEGRKIIVTPGLVELGNKEQDYENFEAGRLLAKACDLVILIGQTNTDKIKDGLAAEKYGSDKILMFNTLREASGKFSGIFKEGDVVLFENDLPDDYR